MLVSNWEVSQRGTPPLASGESAVRMPRAANLCAGLLLPDRKARLFGGLFPRALSLEMNSLPPRSLQKASTVL